MVSVMRVRSTPTVTESLDAVRVYLGEKSMWLTVWAPKGANTRFPNNIGIGNIKQELSLAASTYEGKKIFMYDAAESFSCEEGVVSGGYEYLDDYVVAPGCKLYATVTEQSTAGVHDPNDAYENQKKEWDGFTWVHVHDENRWEKVLLPDVPDDELNANMLKQSVLAKINKTPTADILRAFRVYHNDSGIPSGLPFKGTDTIYKHHWYTAVVDSEMSILVLTTGSDCPSPDASNELNWEAVGAD